MNPNIIHIPEPCSANWSAMKNAGNNQRHCDLCKTNVHDFSKSSLSEINSAFEAANGAKICGHYHERHTTTNNRAYLFANYIEDKLMKINFRRTAIFLVAVVLTFSGCTRKHAKGRRMMGAKFLDSNKQTSESYKQKILQIKK